MTELTEAELQTIELRNDERLRLKNAAARGPVAWRGGDFPGLHREEVSEHCSFCAAYGYRQCVVLLDALEDVGPEDRAYIEHTYNHPAAVDVARLLYEVWRLRGLLRDGKRDEGQKTGAAPQEPPADADSKG